MAGSCAQTALREQAAVPRRRRRKSAAPLRAGAEVQRRVASGDPAPWPRSHAPRRGPASPELRSPVPARSGAASSPSGFATPREGLSASSGPGGPRSRTREPRATVAQVQSGPRVLAAGRGGGVSAPPDPGGQPSVLLTRTRRPPPGRSLCGRGRRRNAEAEAGGLRVPPREMTVPRRRPRPGTPVLLRRASSARRQRRGAATWAARAGRAEGTAGRPGVGRRRRSRQNYKEDDKCLVRRLFSEKLKGFKLAGPRNSAERGAAGRPPRAPSDQRAGRGWADSRASLPRQRPLAPPLDVRPTPPRPPSRSPLGRAGRPGDPGGFPLADRSDRLSGHPATAGRDTHCRRCSPGCR